MSEGWGWPVNARNAHYFLDGRSLCGKWMCFGPVEMENDESGDNCLSCRKKLITGQARAAANEDASK